MLKAGAARLDGLQPSLKNVRQKIPPSSHTCLKFGFSYEISQHNHFLYFQHDFGSTFPRNPTKPMFHSFPMTLHIRWRFQHTCWWIWQFRGCLRHSPKWKKPSNWLQDNMVVYLPTAKHFCYFDDKFLKKKWRKYDLDCFFATWFSWMLNFIIKFNNALLALWRYWRHWIQMWSPISGCENTALHLSAPVQLATAGLSWWAV